MLAVEHHANEGSHALILRSHTSPDLCPADTVLAVEQHANGLLYTKTLGNRASPYLLGLTDIALRVEQHADGCSRAVTLGSPLGWTHRQELAPGEVAPEDSPGQEGREQLVGSCADHAGLGSPAERQPGRKGGVAYDVQQTQAQHEHLHHCTSTRETITHCGVMLHGLLLRKNWLSALVNNSSTRGSVA